MAQTNREARATTPQVAMLRRTLGEDERAPLLTPLVVPEGRELLLVPVLLGDPEPEPEPEPPEPPVLPVLVLAGGAREQGSIT